MIDIVAVFITLFAIVDPIGTVPVFIAVTKSFDNRAKRKIAGLATLAAAVVLLFFIVAGEYILSAMGVPLPAFQIAGGIVLFLFALSMIFGESKPDEEIKMVAKSHDTAIFPLAVPSIAGPGTILTVVLLTEGSRFALLEQIQTALVLLAVLSISYCLMLASSWINKWIGRSGASIISRIMGLILASVAVAHALTGIKLYFKIM